METVLAYFVDGRRVAAADIQHRKANVDANVKRGLPLFFPVRKNLRRADKLLRNMSVVAEIQSAIALIRKHHGSTKSSVQQFAAAQTDLTVTQAGSGRTTSFRRFGPGTILDAPSGIDYDFPASGLDAATYVTILQAELRAIASRLVMPEFMLTSDASNGNYASTMVAEGPAMRLFRPAADRSGHRRLGSDVAGAGQCRRRGPVASRGADRSRDSGLAAVAGGARSEAGSRDVSNRISERHSLSADVESAPRLGLWPGADESRAARRAAAGMHQAASYSTRSARMVEQITVGNATVE